MHKIMLALCSALCLVGSAFAGDEYINTNHRLDAVKLSDIRNKDTATFAGISHPAQITVDKMREILASVQISKRAFWKKTTMTDAQVFDEYAVNYLAPYFVEALHKATSNQVVVFSYQHGNPKKIFGNDRFSIGRAWVTGGNQFHLEFTKLYAKIIGDADKRGYAEKNLARAKGLRIALEAGPGQMLGMSNPAEIIFDVKTTYIPAHNDKEKHREPDTVTERLEELDKLHTRKMITDDEYKAKRASLLQKL